MILVDSSAWIEFLRDTGSAVCCRVDEVLAVEIAVCDPIRMEILAGAGDEQHLRALRGLLARASLVPTNSIDYDAAAAVSNVPAKRRHRAQTDRLSHRRRRDQGGPRRSARRRDFDVLARHTPLELDTG